MYYAKLENPRDYTMTNGEPGIIITAYARKSGDAIWCAVETFQGEVGLVTKEANDFADLLETDEDTRNHYLDMATN